MDNQHSSTEMEFSMESPSVYEVTQSEMTKDNAMDDSQNNSSSDSDSSVCSEPQPPVDNGNDLILDVECGLNKAVLYLNRLSSGSKGACVLFDKAWLTPNEFQYVSGRETAKDWKRSIKHYGKSLKLLIAKGFMTVEPATCRCEGCVVTDDAVVRESDIQPKANQENVPPTSQHHHTSGIHTPEAARPDKDKTAPELNDSHVTGSTGSDGKASVEISERSVLQSLGEEDLTDVKVELAKKTAKKRKPQPTAGDKSKKPKKRSHDASANPNEIVASEATVDDINVRTDQSCVSVSGDPSWDNHPATHSQTKSVFVAERGTEEDGIKVTPENSLVSDGDDVRSVMQSAHCPRSGQLAPHLPLNGVNAEVMAVNELHSRANQITDQITSNKDDGSTSHNDGIQLPAPDTKVTGQSHHASNDSLVANNRLETLLSKPDLTNSSISPVQHKMQRSLSLLSAKHVRSPIAADMTSLGGARLSDEAEVILSRASPLHKNHEEDNSVSLASKINAPINNLKTNGGDNDPSNTAHVSNPSLQVDVKDDDLSDDMMPLSPRKEARLTCIIAELKNYKKQLIDRIEGQRLPADDDIDEDGTSCKVRIVDRKNMDKMARVKATAAAERPSRVRDDGDASQTCKTLFHILSSGNTNNNDSNTSNNNINQRTSSPRESQRTTPDTQPVKSTFEKVKEGKKVKGVANGTVKDKRETPKISDTPPSVATAPIVVPPIPGNMYLAPPLFPYPYGIPPAYLYPGGLYGGFPFPDPATIYKSIAAAQLLPASGDAYSPPGIGFTNAAASSGKHSPISVKRDSSHKLSRHVRKEKVTKSRSPPSNSVTSPYLPMYSAYDSHVSSTGKNYNQIKSPIVSSSSMTTSHSKGYTDTHDSGNPDVLDLSTRKRSSPVSSLKAYTRIIPCYASDISSSRNGMILDLSKGSAR